MRTKMLVRSSFAVVVVAGAVALLVLGGRAQAHSWLGQCTPNFDNVFALTWNYANARNTFAVETGLTAGAPDVCNRSHLACWTYRHRCFNNYINVDDDSGYGHFHLMFTGAGFSPLCGLLDPGDGYGAGYGKAVGGVCTTPDWRREPRVLNTHDSVQWIKIAVETPFTAVPKVFDMPRIRVGGTQPVQLWFRTTSGQWWYWPSLGPNNWNLSDWVHDVDLVRIRGAAGAVGTIQIDDFDILD